MKAHTNNNLTIKYSMAAVIRRMEALKGKVSK